MRQQRLILSFTVIFVIAFVLLVLGSSFYVDLLWYSELGYRSFFWRTVLGRWGVTLLSLFLFGGFIGVNLWVSLKDVWVPVIYSRWLEPRGLVAIAALAGGFFGLLAGLSLGREWILFWRFFFPEPFGRVDPVLGKDISFYVFRLPVYSLLQQSFSVAVTLSFLATAGIYAASGRITASGRWLNIHPQAQNHFLFLLALFFLSKTWGYLNRSYAILFSSRSEVFFGPGYTDLHAVLPVLRVLAVMSFLLFLLCLVSMRHFRWKILGGGVLALVAVSLLGGTIYPSLVQQFTVRPNEIARETPYIRENIRFTTEAYGLDRVRTRDFPVDFDLQLADVRRNLGTIQNIRLWDWRIFLSSLQQLQAIRQYYTFHDADVDRYQIGSRYVQVLLAARELDYGSLPEKTWVNQHLKYTHGYGLAVAPAAEVGAEGQPLLWVKDIPPSAEVEGFRILRPEIYFGEKTDRYVVVGTSEPEFDYPKGDENQYTTYRGRGGIPLNPFARLAFALRTGDYNLLFSRAITPQSRILYLRGVKERVERLAPFLLYDPDPYLVLSEGRLYWMMDAYTVTSAYPYSEPTILQTGESFNYIRNSVKVVVDAYHGDTKFYVFDPQDPLIRSYQRAFPDLFRPREEMSPDLARHIRYPELLFRVQVEKYNKYHMTDPVVFYNKEDLWVRPRETVGDSVVTMDPYYVIMQLPEESRPEFLILVPVTPANRPNMIAWIAGRSDEPHYGELIVYRFPKQTLVYGPEQVEARINQNTQISEKITLWNQQGSRVRRGNLLVIPIENSILYVEPLYLESTATRFPELRRVIVAYGNQVAMGETLGDALVQVFGEQAPEAQRPPRETASGGWAEALRIYRDALARLREGDLAGFGNLLQRLGTYLEQAARGAGD